MGGNLSIFGATTVGIAFLGFLGMASTVSSAGLGPIPLTCLLSSSSACGVPYGVLQYQTSLVTVVPICFWLGTVALVVGLSMMANGTLHREPHQPP
jgi:hypothetical protein